jgi:hypothetical protein
MLELRPVRALHISELHFVVPCACTNPHQAATASATVPNPRPTNTGSNPKRSAEAPTGGRTITDASLNKRVFSESTLARSS